MHVLPPTLAYLMKLRYSVQCRSLFVARSFFTRRSRSVETYKYGYARTLLAHVHSAVACHEIQTGKYPPCFNPNLKNVLCMQANF